MRKEFTHIHPLWIKERNLLKWSPSGKPEEPLKAVKYFFELMEKMPRYPTKYTIGLLVCQTVNRYKYSDYRYWINAVVCTRPVASFSGFLTVFSNLQSKLSSYCFSKNFLYSAMMPKSGRPSKLRSYSFL